MQEAKFSLVIVPNNPHGLCGRQATLNLKKLFINNNPFNPFFEDVPLVEFMYLLFTRMPGESYRRRLSSLLLYLCYVFRALINSLVC